jgi:hypothetical protein
MDRRYYYKDLVPFVVLVANECIITGVNTLFKAATLQGMSKYVFVTYSYAFATIFFFPGYLYHTRFSIIPSSCLLQIICIYLNCLNDCFFMFFSDQEWFLNSVSPSYLKLLFLESLGK